VGSEVCIQPHSTASARTANSQQTRTNRRPSGKWAKKLNRRDKDVLPVNSSSVCCFLSRVHGSRRASSERWRGVWNSWLAFGRWAFAWAVSLASLPLVKPSRSRTPTPCISESRPEQGSWLQDAYLGSSGGALGPHLSARERTNRMAKILAKGGCKSCG
jgi:hypothetical protein